MFLRVSMYNIALTSHIVCILTHPVRASKYSTIHKIYYRPKLIYVRTISVYPADSYIMDVMFNDWD